MKPYNDIPFSKTLLSLACAGVLAVGVSACGGGSSSTPSPDDPGVTTGVTTIQGLVQAPGSNIAYFESPTFLQLAGRFLINGVHAAMTGLGPVTSGTVELIDLDDPDTVLAQATISSTGHYALTLPDELVLTARLALRVAGSNDTQLRAIATHEVVDIDPVSEFITRRLQESEVDLASLPLNEVVRLRGQVDGIEIAAGSDLAQAFANLETAAGPVVAAEISEIAVAAGLFDGPRDYFVTGLTLQFGQLHGQREIWVLSDSGRDIRISSEGEGAVSLAAGEATFTGAASFGNLPNTDFVVETDLEGSETLPGRYRANGTLSLDIPFREEILDEELGIRSPPQTLRFRPGGDLDAFVGLYGESEFLYGLNQDGTLNPDDSIGYRDGLNLTLMVERAEGVATLGDRYGLVLFEQGLGGCVEGIVTRIVMARDSGDTFDAELDEDRYWTSGCGTPEASPSALELDMVAGGTGTVDILVEGDVALSGVTDADGRTILFPVLDIEEEGGVIDHVMAGFGVGLKVADSAPNVSETRWELFELRAVYDAVDLVEVTGFSGAVLAFDESDVPTLAVDRRVSIERNQNGLPVRLLEYDEDVSLDGAVVSAAAPGALGIQLGDMDFDGFISEDGELMVLRMTGNGSGVTEMGVLVGIRQAD